MLQIFYNNYFLLLVAIFLVAPMSPPRRHQYYSTTGNAPFVPPKKKRFKVILKIKIILPQNIQEDFTAKRSRGFYRQLKYFCVGLNLRSAPYLCALRRRSRSGGHGHQTLDRSLQAIRGYHGLDG